MTGPAYPPGPFPGSNAIGKYQVGVSPIGTINPFDVWTTIISQYANSPAIDGLVVSNAESLDLTELIDDFFSLIMNLDTAVGYGLDVWGRIVGVNRVLQVQVDNWFGFAEALPGSFTFNQGTFYNGAPLTSNYALADQSYRTLILAKATSNITDGSIPSINAILMALFPHRGNAYVTEGQKIPSWFGFQESTNAAGFDQAPFYTGQTVDLMTMTYTFQFQLSPVELAIVESSGVLPKSTGVSSSVVIL